MWGYAMDDLKKLTRIILIGLGIYILIEVGRPFLLSLPYFLFYDSSVRPFGFASLISSIFAIAYAILIIYVLFYKANFLTEKIVGTETEPKERIWWLPFAFRLTAVFSGILYLYRVIPSIVSMLCACLLVSERQGAIPPTWLTWNYVIRYIILLALGIYLLYGAPHFVRWQVRKTLEQCKWPTELEKAADEDEKVSP
jgi:NADH:ubiquinone oxidoreductase subunit 5 (subunit L)/multisubunit Na+/H+ antiporter MnhA subunit